MEVSIINYHYNFMINFKYICSNFKSKTTTLKINYEIIIVVLKLETIITTILKL